MILAHSLPPSVSGLFSLSVSAFLFLWGFFWLFFFFPNQWLLWCSSLRKASSDRSECVRVAPDDAFYCNPCLSKSSYNWKLFLRKCWLYLILILFLMYKCHGHKSTYFLFLKNHTKNVLTLVTSCCPHFPAMTLSYCQC